MSKEDLVSLVKFLNLPSGGMTVQDRINKEAKELLQRAKDSGAPLREHSVAVSVVALALFQEEALRCTESVRCFDKEQKRLNGYPQLPRDAVNRAWENFDSSKLCNHCRPYYFVEMAASEMRRCAHFEALIAEERTRGKSA